MTQQRARLIVSTSGGHDGDVHSLQLVHPRVIDLGKDQLIVQAHGVIAAAVEGLGRDAAEITHTGQHDIHQPIEEFVHAVTAKRDHRADRHSLADLECRDRLLRPGHNRLLAGNLAEFVDRGIEHFGVLRGFAYTHVDHDLVEPRHRHGILQLKFFHQSGSDLLLEAVLQTRRLFCRVTCDLGSALFLLLRLFSLLALFFFFFCHCLLYAVSSRLFFMDSKPETYLSNVVPHFLQTRTLRSPRTSWPMRTGPHVPHTSCTFETDIGLSCSAMPPWMLRCGFGRTCFLTIMTCSTRTFPSSGNTRSTRPSLPLSR